MTFDDLEFFHRLQQRLNDEFRDFIIPLISELLQKHGCETLSLTGYTPHFNDGDVCTYSINTYATKIDGKPVGEYYAGYDGDGLKDGCKEVQCFEEFEKLLGKIPETLFRDVFGDHQTIIFHTNDDVVTEEYSHD